MLLGACGCASSLTRSLFPLLSASLASPQTPRRAPGPGQKAALCDSSWCLGQDLRLSGLPAFGTEHTETQQSLCVATARAGTGSSSSFKSCHLSKPGESLQVQRTRSSLSVHLTCSVGYRADNQIFLPDSQIISGALYCHCLWTESLKLSLFDQLL